MRRHPFGLTFNESVRVASTRNNFLFNQGTGEKTFLTERISDLGLNWDMTKYRVYDYTLGRFLQVDPLADAVGQELWTPYHFVLNNPLLYSDPYGDCTDPNDPNCGQQMSSSEKGQRKFWNAVPGAVTGAAETAATMSDLNDATVLATWITRGDGAINIDGSKATTSDKVWAVAGAAIPGVSGSAAKKGLNALVDGLKGSDEAADIHRIGGNSVENLALKEGEKALDPPGISVLKADTPEQAAQQMKDAFPNATKLHDAARVVGSTSEQSIRNAGFDIMPDATKKFPNHHRIIHPNGAAGFNKKNLQKLSDAMVNKLIN